MAYYQFHSTPIQLGNLIPLYTLNHNQGFFIAQLLFIDRKIPIYLLNEFTCSIATLGVQRSASVVRNVAMARSCDRMQLKDMETCDLMCIHVAAFH